MQSVVDDGEKDAVPSAMLIYNLAMLAVDAAVVGTLARGTNAQRRAALAAAALAALVLAVILGGGPFGQMRLLAVGIFVHGTLLTAAAAVEGLFRRRRIAAVAWLTIALLLAGVGVDAFFVEPYWLDVTRLSLRSAKIDKPLRIVAIADFQTDRIGDYERGVFARAAAEEPDLVLFVGDYLQVAAPEWAELSRQFRALLRDSELTAPAGLFAVKGNIDPPQWTELFTDSPVQVFENTGDLEVAGLRLTGLSQADSLDPFLSVPAVEEFHIVFGHHPDFALAKVPADLLIAGHTHGGQVRLPLVGPLLTLSRVPRRWAAGLTPRGAGQNLVVSRGTGMERGNAPRLRFLCRPELVVIDLLPAAK